MRPTVVGSSAVRLRRHTERTVGRLPTGGMMPLPLSSFQPPKVLRIYGDALLRAGKAGRVPACPAIESHRKMPRSRAVCGPRSATACLAVRHTGAATRPSPFRSPLRMRQTHARRRRRSCVTFESQSEFQLVAATACLTSSVRYLRKDGPGDRDRVPSDRR